MSLPPALEGALRSGHPWIYRDHLPRSLPGGPTGVRSGSVVRVEAGSAASYGVYDAEGAIALRLFGERPTRELIARRVQEALALRAGLPGAGSDAYRLLNGEGDYLPGIVCDRYGRHLIMRAYSAGVSELLPAVARELAAQLPDSVSGAGGRGARLRVAGVALRADGLTPLWGELPPPEITVQENGLAFLTDPWRGQKTGLFLDHRDNRQLVRGYAAGKRVLNLFAYNGGFSVYALAGGATSVVSVDIAAEALAGAERNVALNGLTGEHEVRADDLFEALPRYADAGERYDLVILDPPSLAGSAAQRRRALRAYERLNRGALRLVEPGGLLATSSCTAQVSPERFREAVAAAAAAAGVKAQVISEAGQPLDHPVPLAFPEGRYLKFMLLRVLAR